MGGIDGVIDVCMLMDFYGALLTPRQAEFMGLHYGEDLSLAEMAESFGITRQGAYEHIRKGRAQLDRLEKALGLIGRHEAAKGLGAELLGVIGEMEREAEVAGGASGDGDRLGGTARRLSEMRRLVSALLELA